MLRPGDELILRLLERSPFERRGGGWRFGTKTIADSVVERLIAGRQARIEGDRLVRLYDGLTTWCWSPEPEDEGWLIEYTAAGPSDCELLIPDPQFAARRRAQRLSNRLRMRRLRAQTCEAAE